MLRVIFEGIGELRVDGVTHQLAPGRVGAVPTRRPAQDRLRVWPAGLAKCPQAAWRPDADPRA